MFKFFPSVGRCKKLNVLECTDNLNYKIKTTWKINKMINVENM